MRGCWLTVAPREGADWGDSWALHSPWLPQALALCHPMRQPNPSPAHRHMSSYILCGGQTLPHHSSSCLVISCVSVKPFPLSPCLFLVILTQQHNVTHNTDLSFSSSPVILYVCMHIQSACLWVRQRVYVSTSSHTAQPDGSVSPRCQSNNSSSPDTSVSVSSVEAWGNEALRVYWSPYTPLCIRETLFSLPNRNTAPSILYSTPRHRLLCSHSSVPGGLW